MPLPPGFIAPCIPIKAPSPPTGELWLHEIKHDGFRIIARKDGGHVRLYSRVGNDLTGRFPLIAVALAGLRSRSVMLDGEAVTCDDRGMSNFDWLRHRRRDGSVFLYAFDLIELNGNDLRREPLEVRKATLTSLLAKACPGIRINEHIEADGPTVFAHACKMGLEGIVSKRKDFDLSFGAVTRLAEEQEPDLCGSEAGCRVGLGYVLTVDGIREQRDHGRLAVEPHAHHPDDKSRVDRESARAGAQTTEAMSARRS